MDTADNNIDLQEWMNKPASKPLRTSAPRSSLPRQEKGTNKVNDLELKKRTTSLLFALRCGLEIKDDDERQHFLDQITRHIEPIVRDSGLDMDRTKADGARIANEIIAKTAQARRLAALRQAWLELGQKLDTIENDGGGSGITDPFTSCGSASSTNTDLRTTRNSDSLKRDRDADVLDILADNIKTETKRLKNNDSLARLHTQS